MARKIRTRIIEEYETDEEPGATGLPPARTARRRKLFRRMAIGLLLLLALAWFAPWMLSASGLWKSLVPLAAPELAGKLDSRSLSLSWLSPIVARDVTLRDQNGQALGEVKAVRTQRSLLELVLDPFDVGQVLVEEPHLNFMLRADGSNVEDFLATVAKSSTTSNQPFSFSLQWAKGSIEVEDAVAGRRWGLAQVHGSFHWPAAVDQPKTAQVTAAVLAADLSKQPSAPPGDLLTKISWKPGPTADRSLGSGVIEATLTSVPSQTMEGLVRRFALDLRPSGPITAEGRYEWGDDLAKQRLSIKHASSPALVLAAPLTGGTPVQAHVEHLSGVVELDEGQIIASNLELESDVARLSGHAAVVLDRFSLEGLLAALQSSQQTQSIDLQGEIDVALLAEQLRKPLQLRNDTRITRGMLQIALESKVDGGERLWNGTLQLDELTGETAGRPVTWNQPVQLTCTAAQSSMGWAIREMSARASFAEVQGSGTLAEGELTAQADLDQLRRELLRFADLGAGELAGRLSAKLQWQQDHRADWWAHGAARVQQFQLTLPGMLPWKEADLQVEIQAAGSLGGPSLSQLDGAKFVLASAGDNLQVEVQGPLAWPSLESVWPLSYELAGRLETWLPRFQTWLPLSLWSASGQVDLRGDATCSPARIALSQASLRLDDVVVRRYSAGPEPAVLLAIDEPLVQVETTVTWDRKKRSLVSPATTLASSSLAFRADDLVLELGDNVSFTGFVDYRGDLARLSAYFGDERLRNWLLGGSLLGRMEAAVKGGIVEASVQVDLENLAYFTRPATGRASGVVAAASNTPGWQMEWIEPKVSISGAGTYDPAQDRLTLQQAKLDATAISLVSSGNVEELSRTCRVNLSGNLACDMASVSQKLRPILGDTLHMTGKQRRDFELRGPLCGSASLMNPSLSGRGGIGWDEASFLGLAAGSATLDARLDQGIIAFQPLNIAVGDGRVVATPKIYLNEPGMPLVLGKGPAIEKVRISPELCRSWLKYVAPLLADATRAEGKFSLDLEGAAVPLTAPETLDAGGILSIHEAQIGPGPLALTYLNLAMQVKAVLTGKPPQSANIDPTKGWILLPEQQVETRAVQGRVHHRGMTMQVGDVVIRTEGSVGFDQTLELVAAIPVQDKWIEKEKLPAFLKGQTIYIPIRGQITDPKPDGRVLTELARHMLAAGAKNLIQKQLNRNRGRVEQELQKGLDRLFGPATKTGSP